MTDVETELARFEAEVGSVVAGAGGCVAWLRSAQSDDVQFLVAERLAVLGYVLLPELQMLFDDTRASTRYLSAWVALQVGDRGRSIEILCSEVQSDTPWSLAAAGALAKHQVPEAVPVVVSALHRVDPRDEVTVVGYLTALRDLEGELPERIRETILAQSPAWLARVLEADFPADASP